MSTTGYVLGHEDRELERLEQQAAWLAPATEIVLTRAGLAEGMRVLDLGTGAGDVAFTAAEIVGSSGQVVGIDQAEISLEWAERRRATRGLANVTFEQHDIDQSLPAGPFDAVIGRLILLYSADPISVLRRAGELLATNGVVVSMEYEMHAARSIPTTPLVDTAIGWIMSVCDKTGLDPALGGRLAAKHSAAGLEPAGVLGFQSYFEPTDETGPVIVAGVVRTLLPALEALGIASGDDVDIDTLAERMTAELHESDAVLLPPTLVGAWSEQSGGR